MNLIDRIEHIRKKEKRTVIGLMSGTSADGIDAILVELNGSGLETKFKIINFLVEKYPDEIRNYIFKTFEKGKVSDVSILNFVLGELFANACINLIKSSGLNMNDVDLIGSHGQTIFHMPIPINVGGMRIKSTLQIGEPAVIAERTNLPVVADFRVRDVAAGGHGAPIVSYVDYILFRDKTKTRLIQNIGGIANVTVVPKDATLDNVYGFDTGPGNMMIDAAVKILTKGKLTYDKNGNLAFSGRVQEKLLKQLMKHPYILTLPPKTTGREMFGENYTRRLIIKWLHNGYTPEDIITTLTEFTVQSIIENYKHFIFPKHNVSEVILGGGGAYNKYIVSRLKEELKHIKISLHEDYGIQSKLKEALAISILANETLNGNTNNIPNVTGATRPVVMGKIIP
ncbi:MAG: anhydro-N-acetylmuramic acid kinase AnmK [Thermoprotei archaeon]|jgi:anhydro-N-acetylmuramic acid kinase